jgi:molybdopterin converting factor small subunit
VTPKFELHNLLPEPSAEWRRMLRFVAWSHDDRTAASRSVEVLLQRGRELVVQTYDYLRRTPETARILGWEKGVDETHLEERRRFFTIWLARSLGLDTGDEFALYLFRAGKYHAGHGPRQIHTPPEYVTGSIGLVLAAFAGYMAEAQLPANVIAGAMAAWNKYLSVQLNQMLLGYRVTLDLQQGPLAIRCKVFGRLRPLLETQEVQVHIDAGASVGEVLRKFFNYYPQARAEKAEASWVEVFPAYMPRQGWRVLLNGHDLDYAGGFDVSLNSQDEIAIFPPGR